MKFRDFDKPFPSGPACARLQALFLEAFAGGFSQRFIGFPGVLFLTLAARVTVGAGVGEAIEVSTRGASPENHGWGVAVGLRKRLVSEEGLFGSASGNKDFFGFQRRDCGRRSRDRRWSSGDHRFGLRGDVLKS